MTFTGLEKSKPLSSLVTAQVLTLLLTTHNYMDGSNNMTKIIYFAHFVSDHCSLIKSLWLRNTENLQHTCKQNCLDNLTHLTDRLKVGEISNMHLAPMSGSWPVSIQFLMGLRYVITAL